MVKSVIYKSMTDLINKKKIPDQQFIESNSLSNNFHAISHHIPLTSAQEKVLFEKYFLTKDKTIRDDCFFSHIIFKQKFGGIFMYLEIINKSGDKMLINKEDVVLLKEADNMLYKDAKSLFVLRNGLEVHAKNNYDDVKKLLSVESISE